MLVVHRSDGRLVPVLLRVIVLERPGGAPIATLEDNFDSTNPVKILIRGQVLGSFLTTDMSAQGTLSSRRTTERTHRFGKTKFLLLSLRDPTSGKGDVLPFFTTHQLA